MRAKHSAYMKQLGSARNLRKVVRLTSNFVKEQFSGKFAIACRGISGLAIAAPVAVRLNKQLIVVRKKQQGSHGETLTEGIPTGNFEYIIIDDFISLGHTIKEIKSTINANNPNNVNIGIVLYQDILAGDQTGQPRLPNIYEEGSLT